MKNKLVVTFLLTTFLSNAVFAEKIKFDSSGHPVKQAYSNVQKNITSNLYQGIQELKQPVQTSNSQKEIKQPNLIDVDLFNKYLEKNKTLLFNDIADMRIIPKSELQSCFKNQNGGVTTTRDIPNDSALGRVELPWYNGNYIVWNSQTAKDFFCAGEYNKNKILVGYVIIDSKQDYTCCFEYLLKDESVGSELMLNTASIYYKNQKNTGFVYDAKQNILVCSVDGSVKNNAPDRVITPDFLNNIINIFDKQEVGKKHPGLNGYLEENNEIIDMLFEQIPKTISKLDITSMFASLYDGVASNYDTFSETGNGMKLPWYNENYIACDAEVAQEAIVNKEDFIAGVYNKDKLLLGYVFINVVDDRFIIVEYKLSNGLDLPLETIFIYHNDTNKPAFLYDANKQLIVYTFNNNLKIENANTIKNPAFLMDLIENLNN